jgi:hypothetical protein
MIESAQDTKVQHAGCANEGPSAVIHILKYEGRLA